MCVAESAAGLGHSDDMPSYGKLLLSPLGTAPTHLPHAYRAPTHPPHAYRAPTHHTHTSLNPTQPTSHTHTHTHMKPTHFTHVHVHPSNPRLDLPSHPPHIHTYAHTHTHTHPGSNGAPPHAPQANTPHLTHPSKPHQPHTHPSKSSHAHLPPTSHARIPPTSHAHRTSKERPPFVFHVCCAHQTHQHPAEIQVPSNSVKIRHVTPSVVSVCVCVVCMFSLVGQGFPPEPTPGSTKTHPAAHRAPSL